ncbi:MAG: S8 family serine peptidase [Trueperaceae bacterium]|nr:S8 family serine peptidase [Trueperaceae bacterium]
MLKQISTVKKLFSYLLFILLAVFLAACSSASPEEVIALESTVITNVAWGEQVQVSSSAIPASPAVSLRYQIDAGPVQTLTPVFQRAGRVVFILPEMPKLPDLSNFTSPYTVNLGQYTANLTNSQINQYSNRGTVKLTINAGSTTLRRNYRPFGAVEPGEITLLAQTSNCTAFENAVTSRGYSKVDGASAGGLCYMTASSVNLGTAQAMNQLSNSLDYANLWLDKNVVNGLDPRGSGSLDPSCDQISQWLDRAGGSGFTMLAPNNLLLSSNASAAHSSGVTGAGVNVFIVGSGVDANDVFVCYDASGGILFEGHDTHVAEIIRVLAPDVQIEDRVVCDASGNCPSSETIKALLDISVEAQNNSGKDVINMSLGGPLSNRVLERVLELVEPGITVITSSGNGPFAPAHYPAAYSSGTQNPGSLDNIVAVAATGFVNGSWQIAGFNTRNAELFSPGTNLCVATATGFRCDPKASSKPENLGITGSSFAAPVATAMAALYLNHSSQNLQPAELRDCLKTSSLLSPKLSHMVWYDAATCP